jgi:hypothetical protein
VSGRTHSDRTKKRPERQRGKKRAGKSKKTKWGGEEWTLVTLRGFAFYGVVAEGKKKNEK